MGAIFFGVCIVSGCTTTVTFIWTQYLTCNSIEFILGVVWVDNWIGCPSIFTERAKLLIIFLLFVIRRHCIIIHHKKNTYTFFFGIIRIGICLSMSSSIGIVFGRPFSSNRCIRSLFRSFSLFCRHFAISFSSVVAISWPTRIFERFCKRNEIKLITLNLSSSIRICHNLMINSDKLNLRMVLLLSYVFHRFYQHLSIWKHPHAPAKKLIGGNPVSGK